MTTEGTDSRNRRVSDAPSPQPSGLESRHRDLDLVGQVPVPERFASNSRQTSEPYHLDDYRSTSALSLYANPRTDLRAQQFGEPARLPAETNYGIARIPDLLNAQPDFSVPREYGYPPGSAQQLSPDYRFASRDPGNADPQAGFNLDYRLASREPGAFDQQMSVNPDYRFMQPYQDPGQLDQQPWSPQLESPSQPQSNLRKPERSDQHAARDPFTPQVPWTMKAAPRKPESWKRAHEENVEKAQSGNVDIAFFGDSITAGMGKDSGLKNTFGPGATALGIRGDSTQHLLWRMQHGETDFRGHMPDKAVILIGTNNIDSHGSAKDDANIVKGIVATADAARNHMPNTNLLVVGILPRGADPHSPMRARIEAINKAVAAEIAYRPGMQFADVGRQMLNRDGTMSREIYEGDHLHLKAGKGNAAYFAAIKPYVDNMGAESPS